MHLLEPMFCFALICINTWFLSRIYVIHSLWCTLIAFVQYFFTPINKRLVLSVYNIMRDPQPIFFYGQIIIKYLINACVILMLKDVSISCYVTRRSCFKSSSMALILAHLIFDDLHEIIPGANIYRDWIRYTSFL